MAGGRENWMVELVFFLVQMFRKSPLILQLVILPMPQSILFHAFLCMENSLKIDEERRGEETS